jgi:hypothetical protein
MDRLEVVARQGETFSRQITLLSADHPSGSGGRKERTDD